MLVDLLPLVVVVLVQLAVRSGDRLRRFVRLEARVERPLPLGAGGISEPLVAQHQVVVRLQILGVDRQHLLELGDRLGELALQEQDAPELVADDAVARILTRGLTQVAQRLVVPAEALQRGAEEEVRLRQLRIDLQRLAQHRLGRRHVAFLDPRPRRR